MSRRIGRKRRAQGEQPACRSVTPRCASRWSSVPRRLPRPEEGRAHRSAHDAFDICSRARDTLIHFMKQVRPRDREDILRKINAAKRSSRDVRSPMRRPEEDEARRGGNQAGPESDTGAVPGESSLASFTSASVTSTGLTTLSDSFRMDIRETRTASMRACLQPRRACWVTSSTCLCGYGR